MYEPIYLVTGAAGFIGSHSIDLLLDKGYQVVGVDNLRSGHRANLRSAMTSPRFTFVDADCSRYDKLSVLFERYRFSAVLHLAALVSVPESFQQPRLNAEINLYASDCLARLCIEYACKRLVFASSAAVYGAGALLPNHEQMTPQPASPYAAAKLAAEVMLAGYTSSFGLETVCFRYFNVYGPRQDPGSPYSGVLSIFTECYRSGKPVTIFGDGEQTRDFILVTDVATANCQALTADTVTSGHFNVATGQAISLNQVLTIYQEYFPQAAPPGYQPERQGDIKHSVADISKLHAHFQLPAAVPFELGLPTLIKFCNQPITR